MLWYVQSLENNESLQDLIWDVYLDYSYILNSDFFFLIIALVAALTPVPQGYFLCPLQQSKSRQNIAVAIRKCVTYTEHEFNIAFFECLYLSSVLNHIFWYLKDMRGGLLSKIGLTGFQVWQYCSRKSSTLLYC